MIIIIIVYFKQVKYLYKNTSIGFNLHGMEFISYHTLNASFNEHSSLLQKWKTINHLEKEKSSCLNQAPNLNICEKGFQGNTYSVRTYQQ